MNYIELSKSYWEQSYYNDYDKILTSKNEKLRYTYLSNLTGNKTYILDLGCGTGYLEKFLPNCKKYVGVDISKRAIKIAKKNKKNIDSVFICNRIEDYIPKCCFDVIIFNESLYYIKEQYETVNKFFKYLNPSGKIIISIYFPKQNHRSYDVFRNLHDSILSWGFFIESIKNISSGGKRWKIISLTKLN